MAHGTADYTSKELLAMLQEVRMREAEEEAAREKCRVCGAKVGDPDIDYLTDFEITVARQEEGHSNVRGYLCEEHMIVFADSMQLLNMTLHVHGGICFLEDTTCPGHANTEDCPTPEAQYE